MDYQANIYEENVPGAFFVDDKCISCDTCSGIAGFSFQLTEDADHAYVYRQPVHAEEERLCVKAKDSCPVAAIGYNGGSNEDH